MPSDVTEQLENSEAGNNLDPAPIFNERFTIGLASRKFYINLRIGAERRAPVRIVKEGHVRLSAAACAYGGIGSLVLMMFGAICLLYLLKSGADINLSDGQSFLHPIYATIFE